MITISLQMSFQIISANPVFTTIVGSFSATLFHVNSYKKFQENREKKISKGEKDLGLHIIAEQFPLSIVKTCSETSIQKGLPRLLKRKDTAVTKYDWSTSASLFQDFPKVCKLSFHIRQNYSMLPSDVTQFHCQQLCHFEPLRSTASIS